MNPDGRPPTARLKKNAPGGPAARGGLRLSAGALPARPVPGAALRQRRGGARRGVSLRLERIRVEGRGSGRRWKGGRVQGRDASEVSRVGWKVQGHDA